MLTFKYMSMSLTIGFEDPRWSAGSQDIAMVPGAPSNSKGLPNHAAYMQCFEPYIWNFRILYHHHTTKLPCIRESTISLQDVDFTLQFPSNRKNINQTITTSKAHKKKVPSSPSWLPVLLHDSLLSHRRPSCRLAASQQQQVFER